MVRHCDRPGVLARCLDAINAADINVQEMENIVFEGAEAAVARINIEGPVEPDLVDRVAAHPSVLDVQVIAL